MRLFRTAALLTLIAPLVALSARAAHADDVPEGACASHVAGDFDESGEMDLAVGVPDQDVDGKANAGAVHILYGTASGLSGADDQAITQDTNSVDDTAEAGDNFGACLVAADFNGDGQTDLAIGVPGENITTPNGVRADAGAINVMYGAAAGLDAVGPPTDDFIHQNSVGISGASEEEDHFGASLASGDFDGDGKDDLAVGVPHEEIIDLVDAGAVNVIYGANGGLTNDGQRLFHQDVTGMAETSERRDEFGASLAAGDFDDDGQDDLAIGVPGEKIGTKLRAGSVHVLHSGPNGLNASRDRTWDQDDSGFEDTAETTDRFGRVLAAGDLDGAGFDDLAIGIPLEDDGATSNAGAVAVMYGTDTGLLVTGDDFLIDSGPEADDEFGSSLAAADFDDDGQANLAIGTPGEDGTGAVTETQIGTYTRVWTQDSAGIPGPGGDVDDAAETGDLFGFAVLAGDFNGDGPLDLAIGVPGEDIGTATNAGAVNVLHGQSGTGLTDDSGGVADQFWHQDAAGVTSSLDGSESNDRYGAALG